jgi:L-asparagine oxygenase
MTTSTTSTRLPHYELDETDSAALRAALADLRETALSPTAPEFYERNWRSHALLPEGLRVFLEDFRRHEPAAAAVVSGFPVDDDRIGPTPQHWERRTDLDATEDLDLALAMCGLALGEPFCWATLQYGRLVQDVFPIRGDEQRLSGHGSDAFLVFHTDDAFRPDSCDYLLLLGARNPDRVPTYVASVRDIELDDGDRQMLSEPRFHIVPDDEHIRQLEERAPDHPALRRSVRMRDRPDLVPVLFGSGLNPYLRLDGPYMRVADGDPAAQRALDRLDRALHRVRRPVVIEQGSLLILDNHVAAHARESFAARYDGTDRWLRKLIVSRGRRRWAGDSAEPGGRVLL